VRPVVVIACSWSSGHQYVSADAEHRHRHHHQHSQHCAHHRFLNFSVLLSGAGSWLGDGRGDPELNAYVGSAGRTVTIARRVIFRVGSVYA
jgi:hypothetical protein